jgi:hypothetical protein
MKRLGHCTICDTVVFEIVEQRPDGNPTKLGAPLPIARRVTLVLMDGSSADVTFCSACEITPEAMPEIARQIEEIRIAQGQNAYRKLQNGRELTLPQQWRMGAWQLQQRDNVPLGVLYEERWIDTFARQAGGS